MIILTVKPFFMNIIMDITYYLIIELKFLRFFPFSSNNVQQKFDQKFLNGKNASCKVQCNV